MSNHNFNKNTQAKIKDLYLHWKKPQEIGIDLGLEPMKVHNFIQEKAKEWIDEKTFCPVCGVNGDKHKKCNSCEIGIHDFNYEVFNNKKLCNSCFKDVAF